jgi:signal peptidase I
MEHHSPTTVSSPQHPGKDQHEGLKSILSTVLILILAPLTALLLTAFVFQSYQVDGPSMETTLQNKDRLIVSKIPRTWSKLTGNAYIPPRGEIIVFHRNSPSDFGGDKQLIKRVIALPGERVVVNRGVITVFNAENPDGFQPDKEMEYGSVITNTQGNVDLTVPEDSVFVSGDNRGNSLDSRSFGAVPAKDIVGNLAFRVFPFDKAERF